MFVVSFSKKNIKRSVGLGVSVIVISLLFIAFLNFLGNVQKADVKVESSLLAGNENDILTFISSCGWQVDDEPIEIREVIIPETFDEVYNNYNKIQIEQGFNLEKYAGTRVKRWTYIIRNYPETLPSDDYIRINILVSDDTIIGGDVCSVKLDGFMHGFFITTDEKQVKM